MRYLPALAALAFVSTACGLVPAPEATTQPNTDSIPLVEDVTLVTLATTPDASVALSASQTPLPETLASATPLPTPETTFTSSANTQVFGDVTVVTYRNTTRYALLGQTADEIDRYMRQFGPPDSAGTRWFALTDALFNWNDTCVCGDGGCVTGPVTVTVTVDYTFPTWEPPAGADPTLVGQWDFFEDALTNHERGHGDLHSTCGQRLGEAFLALPAQPSCEALDSAMSAASGPVWPDCRAAQAAYEAETNHGQNDGVLWPP